MIKNNSGLALATLVVTVIIMITITSTIVYTTLDSIKLRKLDDMYNDIAILKQKVTNYYLENNKLPVLGEIIPNTELKEVNPKNPNDDENKYYIIDLDKLGGVTLKFGKDYKAYANNKSRNDVYIINETSQTIYYLKGITVEGITKYTLDERYTDIELATPTASPIPTQTVTPTSIPTIAPSKTPIPAENTYFTYTYNSDNTAILTGINEEVEKISESEIEIPTEIKNPTDGKIYKVVSIGENAFTTIDSYVDQDISVNIPYGIQTIEDKVFRDVTCLKSVKISQSVTKIGIEAFWWNVNLERVEIYGMNVDIGEGNFRYSSLVTLYGFEGSDVQTYSHTNPSTIIIPFEIITSGTY